MTSPVRDNPQRSRFEMDTPGGLAFANYRRGGGTLTIMHTEVPRAVEGRGFGSALVGGLLKLARAEGAKVVPACPFVRAYIARHPDAAALLA